MSELLDASYKASNIMSFNFRKRSDSNLYVIQNLVHVPQLCVLQSMQPGVEKIL